MIVLSRAHSYRNVCNQPGYGKLTDAQCESNGVPGLFSCVWCKGGPSDPKLNNMGMGCQQVVPTSTAQCKPVSNSAVKKSSVMQAVANKNCQCSTDFPLCEIIVSNSRANFKPRY